MSLSAFTLFEVSWTVVKNVPCTSPNYLPGAEWYLKKQQQKTGSDRMLHTMLTNLAAVLYIQK